MEYAELPQSYDSLAINYILLNFLNPSNSLCITPWRLHQQIHNLLPVFGVFLGLVGLSAR
jgi:hypothetical protein